jgi:thiamine-monophosphate kinase
MPEFDIIAKHFAPHARHPAARGLRDDAAVLPLPPQGHELVITKDMIAADVHFFSTDAPAFIAGWLLAVNLSDLAAMGAVPLGCVLGLGLPKGFTEDWVARFADALGAACEKYACPLLGGDTVSGLEKPVLSLTAFGTLPSGEALGRGGARAGDLLVVSGDIGGAGWRLQHVATAERVVPTPRLALGQSLRGLATACADVSDGLLADAGHVAAASDLSVDIMLADVPIGGGWASTDKDRLKAVTAGDDYELVFALPPEELPRLLTLGQQLACKLTVIGQLRAGGGVHVHMRDGRVITPTRLGYEHG